MHILSKLVSKPLCNMRIIFPKLFGQSHQLTILFFLYKCQHKINSITATQIIYHYVTFYSQQHVISSFNYNLKVLLRVQKMIHLKYFLQTHFFNVRRWSINRSRLLLWAKLKINLANTAPFAKKLWK